MTRGEEQSAGGCERSERDRVDLDLVDRINAGGPDAGAAFGELYERHKGWAFNVARRMTPNEAAAGDVVQDSFVSLLRQFPGFELTAGLRTYLYAVIRNRARDQRRKDSRLRLVGDLGESDDGARGPARAGEIGDGGERGEREEQMDALRVAVGALAESQREVLILRIVDGFSVAEVARALEIPEGTVKSRLHLAIKALREHEATRGYFE